LEESRRESAKHACAQRIISSPSESYVSFGAQRAQLAKPKFTNSRLARKWHYASLQDQKALLKAEAGENKRRTTRAYP